MAKKSMGKKSMDKTSASIISESMDLSHFNRQDSVQPLLFAPDVSDDETTMGASGGVVESSRFDPVKAKSPELHPETSVPACEQTIWTCQSPSVPSNMEDKMENAISYLSTIDVELSAIPEILLNTIKAELDEVKGPEFVQSEVFIKTAESFLGEPDKAQQNIFDQIDNLQGRHPEEHRALRYSYEIFSFVEGICCMCHDKIARDFIDALSLLLDNYIIFVNELEHSIPLDMGGINSQLHNKPHELLVQLKKCFNVLLKGRGATVSQETCRKAGEAVIETYRGWLAGNGIILEEAVLVYMGSRASAKSVLCKLADFENGKRGYPAKFDGDEKRFFEEVRSVHSIYADAAIIMSEHRTTASCATTVRIDAAPPDAKDVNYLSFEAIAFDNHGISKSRVKHKSGSKLQSPDLELDPHQIPLPKLSVKFNTWVKSANLEDGKLYTSDRKQIHPLSLGAATLVCSPFFDIDQVNADFVNTFNRNHRNPFFKPLVFTYVPTRFLEIIMMKTPRALQTYKEIHKLRLNDFLNIKAINAIDAARRLGIGYVKPTVHFEVTINGIPHLLLSATVGSFSNNDSCAIIDRVRPGIFNLAVRGNKSSKSCLQNPDSCYMGEHLTNEELQAEPGGIGLIVVLDSAVKKEFGDLSKPGDLIKGKCVMPTGFRAMFETIDRMAGRTAEVTGLTVCEFGSTVTVKSSVSAVNAQLTEDKRKNIAQLQAMINLLNKDSQYNKFNKFVCEYFRKLRATINTTADNLGPYLVDNPELLAVYLTYKYKASILSNPFMISPERFVEIVDKKLDPRIHQGTQTQEEFMGLCVDPQKRQKFMECDGRLVMANDKWSYDSETSGVCTTSDYSIIVQNKLKAACKCNNDYTVRTHGIDYLDEAPAKLHVFKTLKDIFLQEAPFVLLKQYKLLTKSSLKARFPSQSIPLQISPEELKENALDPAIIALLKVDIEQNAVDVEKRDCLLTCENVFKGFAHIVDGEIDQEVLSSRDSIGRDQYHSQERNESGCVLDVSCRTVTSVSLSPSSSSPPPSKSFKEEYEIGKTRYFGPNVSKGRGGKGGGTRKKSKIQKRKITRKYKGKNSRHNHTIKNRNIRNYSLRNKQ